MLLIPAHYFQFASSNIAADLIGWWQFTEGSGTTVADSTGNGNTGTLSGSTKPSWTTLSGKNALSFDGSTSYIDLGSSSLLNPTGAWTMTAWINPVSTAGGAKFVIARDDNTLGRSFANGVNAGSGYLEQNGTTAGDFGTGNSVPNSAVTFIVWQSDGSTNDKLFLNGTQTGSTGTWNAQNSTTGSTTIGKRTYSGFNQWWNGVICDVRIYNTAISSGRISTLNTNGPQGAGSV